jgi:integrase
MSLYRRGRTWWTELRYRDWPRIRVSTGTVVKGVARQLEGTLKALVAAGRRDLVDQIIEGRIALADAHDLYHRNRDALEQRVQREASPELGPLVNEWLDWLESPEAISPRTRARYAANTIRRYRMSFATVFDTAAEGRALKLQGLTRGFFLDLRAARIRGGANGVTVNRDLVAVSAFLRWCEEVKDLTVPRFTLPREKENPGRDRWLSADELAQLYLELPAEWVPLFQLLASTGLRVSEALGLTWQDVRFAERTLRVRGHGVETTKGHRRVVPMGQALARTLARHRETLLAGAHDPVFPRPFTAQAAVRLLARVAKRLGWPHTVVHDLRRTFAVHALASGIPLARVQRWLGHRTPAMTLRYAQHAPEPHADDDAARVEASMVGVANRETQAMQALLRVVDA